MSVSYEIDGDIVVVTIERPEARNALTFAMYEELIDREPRMQIPSETLEAAHLEAYF